MAKAAKTTDVAEVAESKPVKKGFVYPQYDEWKVEVEPLQSDKDGDPKQVKLTAIKKLRTNVKVEHNAVQLLNTQSHNSRRRLYAVDTIQNGNEEIITIK